MHTIDQDQIRALFKLLETESSSRSVLKHALASAIKTDPQLVQRVLEQDFAHTAPSGVVHTLEEICWEDLAVALSHFAAKINPDLEEGLALVAKFTSPTTARGKITPLLDEMALELRPVLLNITTGREALTSISHYIFNVKKFTPLPSVKHLNDLSFSSFLEKKQGSNLCIACLYSCIGQRYGLEMEVVDLAGRILVRVQDKPHNDTFAIDPLDNGKILSQEDCQLYLKSRNLPEDTANLTVLSSRLIVRRFLTNMIYLLNKLQDTRRLNYLREYLEILRS